MQPARPQAQPPAPLRAPRRQLARAVIPCLSSGVGHEAAWHAWPWDSFSSVISMDPEPPEVAVGRAQTPEPDGYQTADRPAVRPRAGPRCSDASVGKKELTPESRLMNPERGVDSES